MCDTANRVLRDNGFNLNDARVEVQDGRCVEITSSAIASPFFIEQWGVDSVSEVERLMGQYCQAIARVTSEVNRVGMQDICS